jgi:alkylation response protein AidB-like acyl-CoA dehydrogenase
MSELQANIDDPSATSDLAEVHASAAGLKGFCCNAAAVGIEELRKCCGGAGYLLASGIAAIEADYKWRATAEGDTVVMLLQTARYVSSVREICIPPRAFSAVSPFQPTHGLRFFMVRH